MWFSGFSFLILSLIVEVYLWWKLQASLIFLSGRTCTIGGWLNTFLPHCISHTSDFVSMQFWYKYKLRIERYKLTNLRKKSELWDINTKFRLFISHFQVYISQFWVCILILTLFLTIVSLHLTNQTFLLRIVSLYLAVLSLYLTVLRKK